MDAPNENFALLAAAFPSLVSVAVFGWMADRVETRGGKVPVDKFGIADLLVVMLLVGYLVPLIIIGFRLPPRQIHDSDLVNNAVIEIIIVAALCSFLHFRGINLSAQFGLRAVRIDKAVGLAVLLLVAFYPLMFFVGAVTQKLMPGAKQQELVKFFMEASQKMNYRTVLFTYITGTVIAPVAEELVFRGYIHGVVKRRLGITAGVVLNAALFAGVHVTAVALPVLFLFAVCLTLAYEFTGCILVNICMHSLFNFCNLTFAFLNSTSSQ